MSREIPCVIFEDEHLLVVNKPAGMNTHAPSPYAGEGIYEWLKHREPRWSKLAILHRLDKETSGVMVFGKTAEANRSLTAQFTEHQIRKQYRLVTDRPVKFKTHTVVSTLVRVGAHYASRPLLAGGERAETQFHVIATRPGRIEMIAEPVTGRTHQIRAQAATEGFPVLGDTLYRGTAAARVCLHAVKLVLKHPITGVELEFEAPTDFAADARYALRTALVDERATNAYRLIHGAADGWPGWHVERLGDYLLSQSEGMLDETKSKELSRLMEVVGARGAYHKILTRQVRRTSGADASPQLASGAAVSGSFVIRENGAQFELSFSEGYSVGLFLDQRDNRRRLLANHVAAEFPVFSNGAQGAEVLNTFAYTCGLSVCAALTGARVTSVDLSRKYLEWGKRNFSLNRLDPVAHDFIYGDVFDWLRRLEKKGRAFELILLDPPTFSQSRETGAFQAEKDYGRLLGAAMPLLKPKGVLFASTNAARMEPEKFLSILKESIDAGGRKILKQHYAPQPPDFPVHRDEPAYLKTAWFQVS